MRPTEILRHEHEHILTGLAVLGVVADRAQRGEQVARGDVDTLVDFFRGFADRCHHAKEENALFPSLASRGFPRHGGPVGVMMHEHEEGRALLRSVADTADGIDGDAVARTRFAAAVGAYNELLEAHIHKENEILFVMAERVLEEADDARIAALFERYDTIELGPGERDRLLGSVADLARTYL